MPVRTQSLVKIHGEVLAGGICDGSYTSQRNAARGGALGDSPRLHFHGGGSGGAQRGFLRGGLRYVADRNEHTGSMRAGGLRQAGVETAAASIHGGGQENIADLQRRIQRSTESHTHNSLRPASFAGHFGSPAGVRRACAIRHHPQLPAGAFAVAGPVDRPGQLAHAGAKWQEPVKLTGLGGD